MDFSAIAPQAGLFFSAFVSSTIAPGGSEALLGWLVASGDYNRWQLLWIATLGNTLGAMTSWGLGWWLARYRSPEAVLKRVSATALARVRRFGAPLLLFSWLPVVGDGFCVAAGWLRFPLLPSVLAIACGKCLRYLAVVQAAAMVT